MNPILQAALDFADAGISVVPASPDGSKAPIGSWKQYQVNRAEQDQLVDWFSGNAQGIGVVTGKVSGNLEMLELEGRAVAAKLHITARDIAEASGLGELWAFISSGYVEQTPSGGIHWLYRIIDEPVPGNTKLARKPGENGGVDVLAETRGEGGFVVTAPSCGSTHPSGQPWIVVAGSAATIPSITMEERDALHSIFRALDEMPTKETITQTIAKESTGDKPGDDFNAKATWQEILEPRGWKIVYTSQGVTYWRRPGKDTGISATTGRNDGDNLFVFTTSTTFEAEKPYSKFAAIAHLDHNGDFSQAARALRSQGFGATNSLPSLASSKPTLTVVDPDQHEQERERSTWYPRPLDLTGEQEEPEPSHLARSDGNRLFYSNKINALFGESESGKTWVALLAVSQALVVAEKVIYIDFEDSGKGILNRLRLMGIHNENFANFTYANPDEALTLESRQDLVEALLQTQPSLVVVDGVNAAMTLLGLDLTSNRDATYFSQQLLRPLAMSGAAVVTIDHVTKSKDTRGNYAIGAQAKRADINGAAILVEVEMPFGRGMRGELNLKVTKDRPGHVRAHSKEAKFAGTVFIDSTNEGSVKMWIKSPEEKGEFRPTYLMEQISKLLEVANTPMSSNVIEKNISGKSDTIRLALQILANEGYTKIANGNRNSLMHISIKTYRQESDPKSDVIKSISDNSGQETG
jgi:hypothetical protein